MELCLQVFYYLLLLIIRISETLYLLLKGHKLAGIIDTHLIEFAFQGCAFHLSLLEIMQESLVVHSKISIPLVFILLVSLDALTCFHHSLVVIVLC